MRKAGQLYARRSMLGKKRYVFPHRKQYRYDNIVMLIIINLSCEFYCYFLVRRGKVGLKDENEEVLPTAFTGQHAIVSA